MMFVLPRHVVLPLSPVIQLFEGLCQKDNGQTFNSFYQEVLKRLKESHSEVCTSGGLVFSMMDAAASISKSGQSSCTFSVVPPTIELLKKIDAPEFATAFEPLFEPKQKAEHTVH